MPYGKEVIAIIISYILGCFSTGYYLVRLRTGRDIRRLGSGSTGGRNVGRITGTAGLVLTVFIDIGKGMLAVGAAIYFGLMPWGVMLVLLAVVVGHIWPAQLRFHGGKGIATAYGALLLYDPVIALIVLGLCIGIFVLSRNSTLSGLVAVTVLPLLPLVLGRSAISVMGLLVLAFLILQAHRKNIRRGGELWRHNHL